MLKIYYLTPNLEKIIHSLIWLCKKNNNFLNKMKALKLLFFADR